MSCIAVAAFAFLAAPLMVVIPVSFSSSQYLQFPPPGLSLQWYAKLAGDPRWLAAAGLSCAVALGVVAVALAVGALAALAASRGPQRWRAVIAAGCLAPMIIPNMVIALGLFFAFSRLGLVGTALGLVLAHSLLALPFAFIAVQAGLREIDPTLERAAAALGAPPLLAFRRVVAPLLRPFLATAALFAFVVSFDEIVVSLFLTSVSLRTLPKVMWENVTMFVDPTISAASVLLILVSSLLLAASQALQRKTPGTEARAAA